MKKIALICAGLVALAFSSCSETWDDNPVLTKPTPGADGVVTSNFLNQPAMQQADIVLESGVSSILHLTCSQPDFGFAAPATYVAQVSFGPTFAKEFDGASTVVDLDEYFTLSTSYHDCAEINLVSDEVAEAMSMLQHLQSQADFDGSPRRLYVRLVASLVDINVVSNVVYFEKVTPYFAMVIPGELTPLYVRGGFGDGSWGAFEEYRFYTTSTRGVWETNEIFLDGGIEFKLADSSWGEYNWSSDSEVVPGVQYSLNFNSGNMTLNEPFNGKIQYIEKNGGHFMILVPSN